MTFLWVNTHSHDQKDTNINVWFIALVCIAVAYVTNETKLWLTEA